MRIATRITLGYVVLGIVLSGGLVFEYRLIQAQERTTRHLVETGFPSSLGAQRLLFQIDKLEDFLLKFFVSFDPAYGSELRRRSGEATRLMATLNGLELSEREADARGRAGEQWDQLVAWLERLEQGDATPSDLDPGLEKIEASRRAVEQLVTATQQAFVLSVQASSDAREKALGGLALVVLGTLAATVLAALLTIRSITRPLQQVVRGTQVIGRGEFDHRIPVTGEGEAAELARHFNIMVVRLGEYESLKRQLISHLSHELKAPLASIQETLSLLSEELPGPLNAKQKRLVDLSAQSGLRLAAMIHNLLDLSRLESHSVPYHFSRTSLGRLAATVADEMRPLAEEQGCAIKLRLPPSEVKVRCDSGRIIQVIRNLTDNAIKFSFPESEIKISLAAVDRIPQSAPQWARDAVQGRSVVGLVEVADQGVGIPPSQRARVFEKFQQLSGPGRACKGIGLGLALCKAIVEAHEGAIWIEDGAGGTGASVRFVLGDLEGDRYFNPFFRSE